VKLGVPILQVQYFVDCVAQGKSLGVDQYMFSPHECEGGQKEITPEKELGLDQEEIAPEKEVGSISPLYLLPLYDTASFIFCSSPSLRQLVLSPLWPLRSLTAKSATKKGRGMATRQVNRPHQKMIPQLRRQRQRKLSIGQKIGRRCRQLFWQERQ
jgi:hypothetical protein